METPDFLMRFADPSVRSRMKPLFVSSVKSGEADMIEALRARHREPEFRAMANFRSVDCTAIAYSVMHSAKNEERPQNLSLRPSEDVGWIVENAGAGICMVSSDDPHAEGGRNPLRRFYSENFIDLMGPMLKSSA